MTDDRPAPRPRITRADFILLTVGAELRRAGDYLHHQRVLHDFEARLPELEGDGQIDQVVLRWWTPEGTFKCGTAMKLTPPGTFAGPGFEGGDYVAEGKLPDAPGYRLQVAVHRYGEPEGLAVQGDPWERGNRAALDHAAGVELIEGRYLPGAATVIRLVADERDRGELVKARAIEAAHGRDEVVAAIDARLAALPEAPPAPRRMGRLGLLPLLALAGCWADPRLDAPRPRPQGVCSNCGGTGDKPASEGHQAIRLTCTRCKGTGREPEGPTG